MNQTNSNVAFYTMICITILIGGSLMAAQGCDLQSMVSVDVPPPVLEAVAPDDLEGGITLDEAKRVWEDWTSYVQSNTERLRSAIDDANDRYYALASLIDTGVSILGEHSGAFPFGSIVMTGLGVVTGLFTGAEGGCGGLSRRSTSGCTCCCRRSGSCCSVGAKPREARWPWVQA